MESSLLRPTPRPRRPRLLFVGPLAAVAALATACGGGGSPASAGSTTTTTPSSASAAASRAKYTTCLEQHGVPASVAAEGFGRRSDQAGAGTPGTGSGPTGTGDTSTTLNPVRTQYSAAFQACQADLPTRFGNGGFQNSAAAKAYLNCLQAHGVTVPSTPPTSAGGSSPGGGFGALDQNPAYKAAAAACAPLRPQFGRPTTTTTIG